ncbi:Integrase zinc binding domain [Popillia japonica]|uniref:Integrase zinc binding domain n=1 Tax=Popillia japonica TaxID=7064 RepID=A0AAW1HUD8_POPJA
MHKRCTIVVESKLHTLKRVVAWIIRFKTNCLQKSEESYSKCLSPNEIHNAFKKLVKLSQAEYFEKEIKLLERGAHVAKISKILNLNPILDTDSLLRVGGRLENSLLTSDAKHPLLIHHKHRLARLIAEEEHIRLLHAGPQQVLASIREQFWIVGGRTLVKSVIKRCVTCFKHRPRTIQPIMGQLPAERLVPSPPFSITGIDYAELQQRTKWKKGTGDLKLGTLVVIKEDNCPPLKWKIWKMGRIIHLHPGKDGVTRVATVHTTTGDTKRSYSKLCSLPDAEE